MLSNRGGSGTTFKNSEVYKGGLGIYACQEPSSHPQCNLLEQIRYTTDPTFADATLLMFQATRMESLQVILRPLAEVNEYVDIEVSVSGDSNRFPNIPCYTIRIAKPEPIAEFEKYLAKHIEQYAIQEPFETRLAERVRNAIAVYGKDLYDQVRIAELMKRLAGHIPPEPTTRIELCVLEEPESIISSIHWELLESLQLQAQEPTFQIQVSRAALKPAKSERGWTIEGAETLNILVVVARPEGKRDIPYRNVILPLSNISTAFPRSILCVDIVRLGTWEAVRKALGAKSFGHYKIVHFDVHGFVGEAS